MLEYTIQDSPLKFPPNLESLAFSRSHSADKSINLKANVEHIVAVGVDMESNKYSLKDSSQRFYINDLDKFQSSNSLDKWCIKEACFKALSNFANLKGITSPKLLLDIQIKNRSFTYNAKHLNRHLIGYSTKFFVKKTLNETIVFAIVSTKKDLNFSEQDICLQKLDNDYLC
jgi:phosphopantetheinyl transferase (holo-ACP synthase)